MIKDSGQRTEFENGFVRDMHEGKGRMDLLPWRAIMEVSKHCEEGAKKYGERNIDKGCPQHSLIDSAFRHLAKYTIGETDEDHLRACAWNVLWALQQEVSRPDMIDIPAVMESRESESKRVEEIKTPESDLLTKFEEFKKKILECSEGVKAVKEELETPSHSFHDDIGEALINMNIPDKPKPEEDDCRCVEFTCFYNTEGFCQSVSETWNPELGTDCPDYDQD